MSKLARKLVLSVLTVVLTVIALGTTTFAWFTLTNTTVIQPFEVNITESTGFQMAIGNPNIGEENLLEWVNVLTTEDIEDYIALTYGNLRLNAVTTADGVNFFSVDMNAQTSAPTGYLELPINFRSEQELTIQWTNVVLPIAATFLWEADQSFTNAQGVPVTSGEDFSINAADAVRVAIVGNLPAVAYELPSSATNVVLGGGVAQDLSFLALAGDGLGAAGNLNYYSNKNGGLLPFGSSAVTVIQTITAIANNPIHTLTSSTTAGQAFYGKVMIRVWIEGWDANMYDPILGQVISVSFSFAGVEV